MATTNADDKCAVARTIARGLALFERAIDDRERGPQGPLSASLLVAIDEYEALAEECPLELRPRIRELVSRARALLGTDFGLDEFERAIDHAEEDRVSGPIVPYQTLAEASAIRDAADEFERLALDPRLLPIVERMRAAALIQRARALLLAA